MATIARPHVQTVPQTLFDEFSDRLAKGEPRDIVTGWRHRPYRIRELDPEKAGFVGAIGFGERHERTYFALWGRVPKGGDTISEPEPVIVIEAGAYNAGTWARGHGQRKRETARAEWRRELDLNIPSIKLAAQALIRAHELTLASERPEYWESERHPGDYASPD